MSDYFQYVGLYYKNNIYTNFETAKKNGLTELKRKISHIEKAEQEVFEKLLEEEKYDYEFTITEIDDIEYAEKFDKKSKGYFDKKSFFGKLEPTHKVHYFDYNGKLKESYYEYRYKNMLKSEETFKIYPEDLEEGASSKFKIGDIVKVNCNKEDLSGFDKGDFKQDRLYVIRYLPRKFNGEKYFDNTYALTSLYNFNTTTNKELYTSEYYEKNIQKFEGKVDEFSEIGILSRILKGKLKVQKKYWDNVKCGRLPLNEETLHDENLEEYDDWGFFVTQIPIAENITLCFEKNINGINIKDSLPKVIVYNYSSHDTFSITISDNPTVVIGENKLKDDDFKIVCDFIKNNQDILLKHFDPNNEFYDDELWEELKKRDLIKRKVKK